MPSFGPSPTVPKYKRCIAGFRPIFNVVIDMQGQDPPTKKLA